MFNPRLRVQDIDSSITLPPERIEKVSRQREDSLNKETEWVRPVKKKRRKTPVNKKKNNEQSNNTYQFVKSHNIYSILGCKEEDDVRNLNKNGYLFEASYSKCKKKLANKRRLLRNKMKTETLFNNNHLTYTCKFCRTRQDIPCNYYIYSSCYISLNIDDSNNSSHKDNSKPRRSLRKRN